MFVQVVRFLLMAAVKMLVGANPRWVEAAPSLAQSIYFTNHTSHMDTLALWAALPHDIRAKMRPVAANDYWGRSKLRRFVAIKVLNAVLINREVAAHSNPLEPMLAALQAGDSLIIFPEGTRGTAAEPADFKGGLYSLAQRFPQVALIPVYLDTLHLSMPKGSFFPVPLICTVRFGGAIQLQSDEPKKVFLARARDAILALI